MRTIVSRPNTTGWRHFPGRIFTLLFIATATFASAAAQPVQPSQPELQPVLPDATPPLPLPMQPGIVTQPGKRESETITIAPPSLIFPARPELVARKLHVKPAKTLYWKGLYRDRVVVKILDGINVDLRPGPKSGAKAMLVISGLDAGRPELRQPLRPPQGLQPGHERTLDINTINQLLAAPNVLQIRPLFSTDRKTLQARHANAEVRTGRAHAHLDSYFLIYLKPGTAGEAVADRLNSLGAVEIAYLPPIPRTSDIPPATPDFEGSQGYLDSALEGGIDARFAWTRLGGHGAGMKVIDVEAGWNLDHEDLPPPFFTHFWPGINSPGWIADENGNPGNFHGTAVLGILVAKNDARGVTGIASEAAYNVESIINLGGLKGTFGGASGISDAAVANAVVLAEMLLSPGDVIVIPLHSPGPPTQTTCPCNCRQFEFVPMEFFPADFDAIQNATSNGIVVVEAAGNGSVDLDSPVYGDLFNRNARDSGAILVGASLPTGRVPACFSNSGTRVDMHGWGDSVTTTGGCDRTIPTIPPIPPCHDINVNGQDQNQFYTHGFSGTSSATPIVAGAVLSLQGTLKASRRDVLAPGEVRRILAETGTPQVTPVTRNIGPLPNLHAAIEQLLGNPTPPAGGAGGTTFALDCNPGQMLAGVRGHAGWYINQVVALCKNGAGVLIESGARGGTGGSPFETQCDTGQGVTGIIGFSGAFVDSLRLECKSAPGGAAEGDVSLSPSVGGSNGQAFGPFRCGRSQIAMGLRGRAGAYVDDLQLDCAVVALDMNPAQGWISPAAGGTGGTHFERSCPPGQVLAGVRVRAGSWIDAVRPLCVPVAPNGSWTGDPSFLNLAAGGTGGDIHTQECPRDNAIFEMAGRGGSYIDRLSFGCRPLDSATTVSGNAARLGPFGGSGGDPFGPHTCPSSLAATGLQGSSGDYVDRLQLICGRP